MTNPTYSLSRYSRKTKSVINLTNDIIALPSFTDTGTGEVNSMVVVLSGAYGKNVTDSDPIADYDLLFLTDIDANGFLYSRVFQVRRRLPIKSKQSGIKLEVHATGLEWTSQFRNYAFNFFTSDAFSVAKDIQREFNENGINDPNNIASDPLMQGLDNPTYNQLPNWTSNNYNFAENEEKCYNRLLQVLDKVAAPTDDGGVFDYFEIGTIFDTTLSNTFTFKIFSSGSHDSGKIIQGSIGTNLGESEAGLDAFKASVKNAWGDVNSGTIPLGYSQFSGGQLTYDTFPSWNNTVTYPSGSKVQYLGSLWKCIVSNVNNSPGPGLFWQEVTRAQYYGNKYIYSEWTNKQVSKWVDCGSNIGGLPLGRYEDLIYGFWDSNLVINNGSNQRTWVDFIALSEVDIGPLYKYPHSVVSPNGYYVGMRVLVAGSGSGIFSGNDINGVPFNNNIVQYMGDDLGWIVVKEAQKNFICAVLYEGQTYVYDDTTLGPGVWSPLLGSTSIGLGLDFNANDCFHPYNFITQDDIQTIDPVFAINSKSAVKVTYSWIGTIVPLLNVSGDANWYRFGAWINFRFPFPPNVVNEDSAKHSVGEEYGSDIYIKGPSTLDAANMSYSHDGATGFATSSSEWLGPLSSLDFLIRLRATYKPIINTAATFLADIIGGINTAIGLLDRTGLADLATALPSIFGDDALAAESDFKMRCAIYDINDNVVIQDFTVPFNDEPVPVKLPLSGFVPYTTVSPLQNSFDLIIPPQQPPSPVFEFEWRHIKQIAIFTAESYDSFGRYNPSQGRYNANFKDQSAPLGVQASPSHKLEMWIDAFRFTKPLFVSSDTWGDQELNVESEPSEHPEVLAYQQLKSIVKEEYWREVFPHKEYDITTTLAYDIKFGDKFWYYDPLIVENDPTTGHGDLPYPNSDMPSDATVTDGFYDYTVGLVAKKIDYSYTKPENGAGGALRTLVGVKRYGQSA